jgi:hypothetical protein
VSKPVILVIGHERLGKDGDMSYRRDGFCFYIQEHFQCETLVFDSLEDFESAIEDVKFLGETGRLIMALVLQHRHMPNEHLVISRLVRKRIFSDLKIINIKNSFSFREMRGYYFQDKKLIAVIKKHLSNYKPKENYFGIESKKECNFLISQLDKVYWKNYSETIPPTNDQVVLEAMRLRLLSPGPIKEEFDIALRNNVAFGKIQKTIYEEECRIIRNMAQDKRDEFLQLLLDSTGAMGASYGDRVSSVAIDSETLVYSISSGWGNHIAAMINNVYKIETILFLKK